MDFTGMDWQEIGKYLGLLIAGKFSIDLIIGIILAIIPNAKVFAFGKTCGAVCSKVLGQKVNATTEDKLEDTAVSFLDGFEKGLKDN